MEIGAKVLSKKLIFLCCAFTSVALFQQNYFVIQMYIV